MGKTGRPPITLNDLPKDWETQIIALASDGASIVELSVELGINRSTFYELSKRDKHFSNTIKRCKELSEQWWEKEGRTNLKNRDFNYVGWYMNMKNRFGWRDRHDVTSGDKPVPILGTLNVSDDDSAREDSQSQETN